MAKVVPFMENIVPFKGKLIPLSTQIIFLHTGCDPWCPNLPNCEHGYKHMSDGGCRWMMCECAEGQFRHHNYKNGIVLTLSLSAVEYINFFCALKLHKT